MSIFLHSDSAHSYSDYPQNKKSQHGRRRRRNNYISRWGIGEEEEEEEWIIYAQKGEGREGGM